MMTDRDNNIIQFINTFDGLTINQCAKLFFNNAKYGKDLARKRLKKLADKDVLKYENDWATNQRVYFIKRKPSSHSIILLNFYSELIRAGSEILEFTKEYKIENICRPDAFLIFKYNNKGKMVFVEVDMQHKTDLSKYQKLYDTELFQREYNTFPEVIIISSTNSYEAKGYNFSIKILDYSLKQLKEKILYF
ncbi:hypothetical protein JOC70_000728 [Clostridium pascui]|uniref:hypothetical protein n=1 Tax=Clostridium pascui TaxID=46609 RepID=UPI0019595F39|nr:hypothetical protein [Clostridium pascui]MBM7869259.1 hypothetical protein [Clostridium pascui]